MTTSKIFLKVLFSHAVTMFISLLFMVFLSVILRNNMTVLTVITALIYAGVVYSAGWNSGVYDSRKLPGHNPDVKKAVKASLIFAIIPTAILIFRVICPFVFPMVWAPRGEGFAMIKTLHPVTSITDIIYRIFFLSFIGFMQNGDLLSYFLPILVIPIFVPLGYLVGLRRFSITEKYAPKMIYQNKNKNKEK